MRERLVLSLKIHFLWICAFLANAFIFLLGNNIYVLCIMLLVGFLFFFFWSVVFGNYLILHIVKQLCSHFDTWLSFIQDCFITACLKNNSILLSISVSFNIKWRYYIWAVSTVLDLLSSDHYTRKCLWNYANTRLAGKIFLFHS